MPARKQRIKLIINVEAQKEFRPGYSLITRGIFYGARILSSQKEPNLPAEIMIISVRYTAYGYV